MTTDQLANHTSTKNQLSRLSHAVFSAATGLQNAYLGQRGEREEARARAVLAKLRAAVGRRPEDDLLAWQEVLTLTLADGGESLAFPGKDEPSREERSAYEALTLFGLHMQSQRQAVNLSGQSFARACGLLVRQRNSASIKPRFDSALIASSEDVRKQHLRGLVTLLRAEKIGFDYGILARDLSRLQTKQKNRVLLSWGRDFATAQFTKQDDATDH